MTETISNQLKLSEHIQMEIKDELSNFNQELIEDSIESFYFIEENGNKSINIENVNSFLEKIKNQDWKEMTNSNQDKLWTTAVQIKLVSLGYNIGNTGIDGYFGKNTRAAVREFQKNNDLTLDAGYPGTEVINKMLSTETIIGDNIMSENEFNINIEPIITELNLQPIDNFLYSREGFPGKYTFNKDGTLFYLGDSERLPQRYEFQTKKWIVDISHLKNLTISELNLETTTSRGLYNRTGYTGSYNFDQRGILHYSGDAKNPPQTYDYLGKRRTLEAEREQLIKEYSLQATSKGFYTNNRQGIYSFDTKGNLFYRSEKEGTQKLQNGKWNQIPFKELPQNLQNKDATIHILGLKPHSNNKNIYTRNGYKGDYSFQENLLSYKEHNYTQYYRNNKRMT